MPNSVPPSGGYTTTGARRPNRTPACSTDLYSARFASRLAARRYTARRYTATQVPAGSPTSGAPSPRQASPLHQAPSDRAAHFVAKNGTPETRAHAVATDSAITR